MEVELPEFLWMMDGQWAYGSGLNLKRNIESPEEFNETHISKPHS